MNISINEWNESILKEMVKFSVPIWRKQNPNITESRFENWFKNLELDNPPIAIIAKKKNELLGWVFLVFHSSTEAEINPWALGGHPIISLNHLKNTELKKELILEAIKHAKNNGITRVDIHFREEEGNVENHYDFYNSLDLRLIEENCHMRQNLSKTKIEFDGFPEGLTQSTVKQVNQAELYKCYYESFRNSDDRWMSDKTDEEMKDHFDTQIIKNRFPLIEDASATLLKNNQVIAFAFVHQSHGDKNGQLWIMGVRPNFRRQGLGKALINHIKYTLIEQGFASMSLNVDISNIPACNLYLSQGYVKDWTLVNFAWTKEV